MTTTPGPLGLQLPTLEHVQLDSPFSDVRGLDAWIRGLPIANVGESTRLVYTTLHRANRTTFPAEQRLKGLEALRQIVQFLTSTLEKHFLDHAFPLPERNYRVAELVRELDAEMAAGYKRVLEELLQGADAKIDAHHLLIATQRALHYLAQTVLISHQLYSTPFAFVWLDIHFLYLFAEQNHIQDTPVVDELDKISGTRTIAETYKCTLLFALANPFRLAQRNIQHAYALAELCAKQCELLKINDPANPPGLFVVELDQDRGPGAFRAEEKYSTHIRAINTARLIQMVKDQGAQITQSLQTPGSATRAAQIQHQELLLRLVTLWGAVPQRGFSRQGNNHHTQLVLGLPAIYQQLPPPSATIQFAAPAQFRVAEAPPSAAQKEDIWALAERYTLAAPTPPPDPPTPEPTTPARPAPFACYVTNESAGGCRLIWKDGEATRVGIGMLIGIQSQEQNTAWQIGVVRWLKAITRHDLVLGIEFLAQHATAVAVRRSTTNPHDPRAAAYTRALTLPETPAAGLAQTLITPPDFKEGAQIELFDGTHSQIVRLARRLESSGNFCQFEYAVQTTPDAPTSAPPAAGLAATSTGFDTLWSQL
ncbi:MAG: hypothetical protein AABY83_04375 [Pseudomonadota bacterium]